MKITTTTSTKRGACSAFARALFGAALLLTPLFAPAQTSAPTITAMAAGGSHSLLLKSDGTVWAMGSNAVGQFGDGTTTSHATPVQVKVNGVALTNVTAIAAGAAHSLFLKNDHTLWATGANYEGQLGNGAITDLATPTTVPVQVKIAGVAVTDVKAIAACEDYSLFLRSDNTLWAMGYNFDSVPTQVPGGTDVKIMSAGDDFITIVKNDGWLWESDWGGDFYPVGQDLEITAVAAGGYHNGGCTLANGTLYIKRGDDTVGLQVLDTGYVIAVAAGGNYDYGHTLFIRSDHTLWAFGDNNWGQLGDGTTKSRSDTLVKVFGGDNVKAVVASCDHTLFLKEDGTVWGMGRNGAGQLGNGYSIDTPTLVQVVNSGNVTTAAAATDISMFIKNDRTLWRMGGYDTNPYTDHSTPAQVSNGADVTAAAIGGDYRSLFVKTNNTLWAEDQNGIFNQVPGVNGVTAVAVGGFNNRLFLSNNTLWAMPPGVDYGMIAQVPGADSVKAMATAGEGESTGVYHTLLLKTDNTLYAMGDNDYGQLGDGTTTSRDIPAPVKISGAPVTNVTAIAAGGDYYDGGHSLFIKDPGALYATGRNDYGQLGDGTTTNRSTPVPVKINGVAVTDAIAVAAGTYHSLFARKDGTLWAMGWNAAGQLGDGTTTNRATPVQVPGATNVKAVYAGLFHSLFLKTDNTLWAMGGNGNGELGDGSFPSEITNIPVPATLTTGTTGGGGDTGGNGNNNTGGGGGGGGGGAPSLWFLAAFAALTTLRGAKHRK